MTRNIVHRSMPTIAIARNDSAWSRGGTVSIVGRNAFSLIEVLIALALTVLLLSAVYAAVGLHLRFQTAGRSQISRAQLLRALIRKIDEDFSSVTFLPEEEVEEDTESSVENVEPIEDLGDTALTVGGLESEGAPITFGIVGTTEFMHLCVSRPLRDLSYDSLYADDSTSGRSNDLLTVTYGIGPVDLNRLMDPTRPKYDDPDPNAFANRPETAFARRSLDLYSFDAATDILLAEDVIAPEISEVAFEYFDGTAWLTSWDSRAIGALPRAVRVKFGFWSPGEKKDRRSSAGFTDSGTVSVVEHIFHVPLAVPLAEVTE